jgi:hypothetical protein
LRCEPILRSTHHDLYQTADKDLTPPGLPPRCCWR